MSWAGRSKQPPFRVDSDGRGRAGLGDGGIGMEPSAASERRAPFRSSGALGGNLEGMGLGHEPSSKIVSAGRGGGGRGAVGELCCAWLYCTGMKYSESGIQDGVGLEFSQQSRSRAPALEVLECFESPF